MATKSRSLKKENSRLETVTDIGRPAERPRNVAEAAAPPAAKKKTAKKKSSGRKSPAPERAQLNPAKEPSADEIRLRAYFIAESRSHLQRPGDEITDWLEARQQLFAEAGIPLS